MRDRRHQERLMAFHDGILLGLYLGGAMGWAIAVVWTLLCHPYP